MSHLSRKKPEKDFLKIAGAENFLRLFSGVFPRFTDHDASIELSFV